MRSENQEGLPSHAPKRTNGADRRNDHSGRTQQGAQQPAGTKNLRENNVELRLREVIVDQNLPSRIDLQSMNLAGECFLKPHSSKI